MQSADGMHADADTLFGRLFQRSSEQMAADGAPVDEKTLHRAVLPCKIAKAN